MVYITQETARDVIAEVSKSNRQNIPLQIQARMEVHGSRKIYLAGGEVDHIDNVVLIVDGNRCITEGHIKQVLISINKIVGLNIRPVSLFGESHA